MQLSLEGRIAKVLYFGEADIWFEAKPLVLYLEYNPSHVSQTLTLVKEKHKKSLKELLETRGKPGMGELSEKTPGYCELKALYINEPGLYSLIFRSTKKQAQAFQDWVYEEVLTALRRRGIYSMSRPLESSEDVVVAPIRKAAASARAPTSRPMLAEDCLKWETDLGVSRSELPGVRAHFKTLLLAEVAAGGIPQRSPIEAWAKAPPRRLLHVAQGAVDAFRHLLERRCQPPEGPMRGASRGARPPSGSADESTDESDVLKISEIMRAAGVWSGVWSSFRSDLSNQMLFLKCAETEAAFAARRPETVRGHIQVSVHAYKKSVDWPLAWKALQNTRDVYEKRVREFLDDMFEMAGRRADTHGLARDIAATLRVNAPSDA